MANFFDENKITESELEEAVQELRPTYYDIVQIPYSEDDRIKAVEKELKECEESIIKYSEQRESRI